MARRHLAPPIDRLDLDPPPSWSPSLLRQMLRRPVVYWSAAALLALLSVLSIERLTMEARSLQSIYGNTTPVLVTTVAVPAGAELGAVTETRLIPVGLLPQGAVSQLERGQQAAVALTRGSILTEPHVAGGEALRTGEAAVAIPVSPLTPSVTAGQRILVVLNADPFVGVETQLIAARVMLTEESHVVAVLDQADLVATSAALQSGVVTIALVGP